MERSTIIKALEHCANYKKQEVSCIDCPLEDKCGVNTLESYALALIKELTEENEWLKSAVNNSTKCFLKLHDEYQTLKADTVRDIQTELSLHFGTYTEDTAVKVCNLFKVMDKIAEKILNENTEDENK